MKTPQINEESSLNVSPSESELIKSTQNIPLIISISNQIDFQDNQQIINTLSHAVPRNSIVHIPTNNQYMAVL